MINHHQPSHHQIYAILWCFRQLCSVLNRRTCQLEVGTIGEGIHTDLSQEVFGPEMTTGFPIKKKTMDTNGDLW